MATSYAFDKHTNKRLTKIKERTGASSNTEVIRQAVALLEMASRGNCCEIIIRCESGDKIVLIT